MTTIFCAQRSKDDTGNPNKKCHKEYVIKWNMGFPFLDQTDMMMNSWSFYGLWLGFIWVVNANKKVTVIYPLHITILCLNRFDLLIANYWHPSWNKGSRQIRGGIVLKGRRWSTKFLKQREFWVTTTIWWGWHTRYKVIYAWLFDR